MDAVTRRCIETSGTGNARHPDWSGDATCLAATKSLDRVSSGQLVSPVIRCMAMADVSIRDLRNHGGEVIDRVIAGERVTITRDGRRVAELRAAGRTPLPATVLLERWSRLPHVDPVRFRHDVDTFLDPRV
jgi:antitoxin (DNA-binding transcriptional repressor) of toxin-antitoxin stability system